MMEAAIGLFQHGIEVGKATIALEEGAHDAPGGVGIVEARQSRDFVGLKLGPSFRQKQPAIPGKGSQERAFKGKGRRLTARADKSQGGPLWAKTGAFRVTLASGDFARNKGQAPRLKAGAGDKGPVRRPHR